MHCPTWLFYRHLRLQVSKLINLSHETEVFSHVPWTEWFKQHLEVTFHFSFSLHSLHPVNKQSSYSSSKTYHECIFFSISTTALLVQGFPGGSDGKESTCNVGDLGSIPGLGRCPEEGHSYPLQYSCLENSMDRGAWRAIVCGVAESDMTEWLSTAHILAQKCHHLWPGTQHPTTDLPLSFLVHLPSYILSSSLSDAGYFIAAVNGCLVQLCATLSALKMNKLHMSFVSLGD